MTQQSLEPRTVAEDAGAGSRVPAGRSWLDRYFHISRRGSSLARELRGGTTTFMAMAYILLLNPLILSGKDAAGNTLGQQALITATAFAAALSTLLMGFFGKVPLALAMRPLRLRSPRLPGRTPDDLAAGDGHVRDLRRGHHAARRHRPARDDHERDSARAQARHHDGHRPVRRPHRLLQGRFRAPGRGDPGLPRPDGRTGRPGRCSSSPSPSSRSSCCRHAASPARSCSASSAAPSSPCSSTHLTSSTPSSGRAAPPNCTAARSPCRTSRSSATSSSAAGARSAR